jgi:hypothetical protein
MIETVSNDAAGWPGLRSVDIPVLQSFTVRYEPSGPVLVVTTESVDGRTRLEATFLGIAGLQVSWPEYPNPLQLDVISIRDVSADGLENISFRVAEGGGFFAFSCSDFFAVVQRS